MSSSMDQHYYDEQDKEIAKNKEYLNTIADEVLNTPAFGSEFENRRWLENNKEKILRTKRLIDLLK